MTHRVGESIAHSAQRVAIAMVGVNAEYFPGQPILQDLTLLAPAGEVCLIIGPNGSGKSTALRVLAGLLRVKKGRVELTTSGSVSDITSVPAHQRSSVGVGFMPQGHTVFPGLTVQDNLLLGGWSIRKDKAKLKAGVEAVCHRYPVLAEKRSAAAGSLSGGQQRILELARLLVADPQVLLIDEPSAGVSPAIAAEMYGELAALRAEGRTIVLVDQDVRPALAIADTVHVLQSGRVNRSGSAREIGDELGLLVRGWLSTDSGESSKSGIEETS